MLIAILARVVLVLYSEIIPQYYPKAQYDDVDYMVYTDAAGYLLKGGSPYDRHTYRYTPFLAYIMIPNIVWHHGFGKILFCISDLLVAMMIKKILNLTTELEKSKINILAALWTLNPLIINVSTRGNADTMVVMNVIAVMLALLNRRYKLAGFLFGFVVHFKIYPVIYALPIYFWIDHHNHKFFTKNRL